MYFALEKVSKYLFKMLLLHYFIAGARAVTLDVNAVWCGS